MESTKRGVGRKIIMAVTGLILFCFVIGHMLGNTTIFFNAINAYAEHLRALGPFLWVIRGVMLLVFAVHIWYGIELTMENRAATGQPYVKKVDKRATFSSKTMIISGLVLLVFVIYHLGHFTFHVGVDEAHVVGDHIDVYAMVIDGFRSLMNVLIYGIAMVLLYLHVAHGGQSFLHTLGLSNDKSLPVVTPASKLVAVVLLIGYISIPLLVIAGVVKL